VKRGSVSEIGSRSRHGHSRNESARTEQEPKGLDELNHYEDEVERSAERGVCQDAKNEDVE
jgi:hypothetical protein